MIGSLPSCLGRDLSGYQPSWILLENRLQSSNGTKEDHFERVLELRSIFRKGVYWSKDLNKGEIVKHTDLVFLKPVKGLDVVDYESILGRVTTRRVKARDAVVWEDLNP